MEKKLIQKSFNIRKKIIFLSYTRNSAHLGSCLSCVEILVAILGSYKKVYSKLVVSKGHAAMAFYAALNEFNFISKKNFNTYLKNGSELWGHITKSKKKDFFDFSFGALGYGPGISAGISYALKEKNKKHKVYCLVSDGELNEGTIWESLMFIAHHNLKNIIIFIDNNKIQSFGFTKDVLNLGNLKNKFNSFGFSTFACNGHSIKEISNLINLKTGKPKIIICNTVKGKGLKRIENKILSHYKPALEEDLELYEK